MNYLLIIIVLILIAYITRCLKPKTYFTAQTCTGEKCERKFECKRYTESNYLNRPINLKNRCERNKRHKSLFIKN